MLGGGFFRDASVLLTGAPGTAKTTLCGAFAEAACERGERVLYLTYDSAADEVVRNLTSVGVRLERFRPKGRRVGLLAMTTSYAISGNAETHLMQIKALARLQRASCVVIDPLSALVTGGSKNEVNSVSKRLVVWAKSEGLTLLCTSLLDSIAANREGSPLQISTIADTWIHLSYNIGAGERNRALTIIKSRGTAHSNQVRELVLDASGITLADAYVAEGEVLMGTLRWERENADRAASGELREASRKSHAKMIGEEADLAARLLHTQRQLEGVRAEIAATTTRTETSSESAATDRATRRHLRGADARARGARRSAR
jgi:circadian clock protein KaiC